MLLMLQLHETVQKVSRSFGWKFDHLSESLSFVESVTQQQVLSLIKHIDKRHFIELTVSSLVNKAFVLSKLV